jgi:two-component system, OmpR family, sensor histidine kinase KdpD
VLSLGSNFLPSVLRIENGTAWIVVVLITGLALAFLVYIIEKESSLRKMSSLLIDEQAHSIALSRRLDEISALLDVNKALNATLETSEVFRLILSSALQLLGGSQGLLLRYDELSESLRVVSHQGSQPIATREVPLGKGLAGAVAAGRKPVLITASDIPSDDALVAGAKSSLTVPLIRRDELFGVLMVNQDDSERSYSLEDLRVLELFAEQASIAIANASELEREREAVARLQELTRMKSDFVATVTHELKTPLTAIIGASKTMARKTGELSPEMQASLVDMIDRQGSRLLRMVQDVLTASRIESATPRLHRASVDLRSLAEEVIGDLAHTWETRSKDIVLTTDPAQPRVWGDRTALGQILSNLVENAVKYSEEGDRVGVTLRETASEVVVVVADEGHGISPQELQTIFERFRRVDAYSPGSISGFGLGLYIVQSLVQAHDGSVDVASEHGRGTTFTVHLPKRSGGD